MTYAFKTAAGEWIEIVGPSVVLPAFGDVDGDGIADDVTVSDAWVAGLTDDERAAKGVVALVETDPPSAAHVLGSTVADVAGVPTRRWTSEPFTLDEIKAGRKAAAEAAWSQFMRGGYAVDFGTVEAPDVQTLQLRDNADRTNWLTFKDACDEAVAAGLGDQPAGLPIRTASNATKTVTNARGVEIMRGLRAWAAGAMGHLWGLKDAIDAAADAEAVAGIDLTTGWPA